MPLLLHPFPFMDKFVTIDETLPPSLRLFLCVTIVALTFGGLFFSLLWSLSRQRKKELEEFSQKEHDFFM